MSRHSQPSLIAALVVLLTAGCTGDIGAPSSQSDQSSVTSGTPGSQTLPSSGDVLSGAVTGAKVGAQTRVGLYGSYTSVLGETINAFGQKIDTPRVLIASAQVKDGRYSLDIPKAPVSATKGQFALLVFNDANGNTTVDASEDQATGSSSTVTWNGSYFQLILATGSGSTIRNARKGAPVEFN